MLSGQTLAILSVIISAIIWGAAAPIFKWSLSNIPVFSLAFLRFFLATIIAFPLALPYLKVARKDWDKLTLAALFGITLNIAFFFWGLKLTLAINAALIIATVPILTALAAYFYLREKIDRKLIIASLLAFLGLTIIVGPPILNFGLVHFLGAFFLILASLTWVAYEIISKKLFQKYSAVTITFHTFWIGALTFLPLALLELIFNPFWPQTVNAQGVVGILYGAIFSSFIAYFAWQWGLFRLKASEASFFFYLDPISGVLVATFLLGEKITLPFIIGALLISLAVFMAEYHRKIHPIHKKELA